MTNDPTLAREARILGLRLEFGLVELEEVERWADRVLLAQEQPDEQIIDLALARKNGRSATFGVLLKFGGPVVLPCDVLAAVADVKVEQLSAQRLTSLVESIAAWAIKLKAYDGLAAKTLWHGYALSDDLALESSGVLSKKEVDGRLLNFFDAAKKIIAGKGCEA